MVSTKIVPVLLAGGGGSRLWPVSRDSLPKQFQPLVGSLSTFQQTLQRVSDPDLFEDPLVITSEAFRIPRQPAGGHRESAGLTHPRTLPA